MTTKTRKSRRIPTAQLKISRPRQYLAETKQAFCKEYFALPRAPKPRATTGGPSKRCARGALKALLIKYNVSHCTIFKSTGWLWQYSNGGWDSTYAVGFTRQGNATMV